MQQMETPDLTPEERQQMLELKAHLAEPPKRRMTMEEPSPMPKVQEVTPNQSQSQHQPKRMQESGPPSLPSFLNEDRTSSEGSANPQPPKPRVSREERELTRFFTYQFGPVMVLILCMFTRNLEKASFYAMNPEECAAIAPHAAKLGAKFYKWFNIPPFVHEAIVNSEDHIALAYVLYGYLDRIGMMDKIPNLFNMFFGGTPIAQPIPQRTEPVSGAASSGNGKFDISSVRGLDAIHTP